MKKLKCLWPSFLKRSRFQNNGFRYMSITPNDKDDSNSKSEKKKKSKDSDSSALVDLDTKLKNIKEPTNCCMSGCPKCVWIEYAEKLSEILKDSPDDVQKIIIKKVHDPNMRAFLLSELKVRKIGN